MSELINSSANFYLNAETYNPSSEPIEAVITISDRDDILKFQEHWAVHCTRFAVDTQASLYYVGFIDYESFTPKTTLANVFKKRDCLAILFHIKNPSTGQITAIGHWTLLIKPSKANKNTYQFFDSLGLGL